MISFALDRAALEFSEYFFFLSFGKEKDKINSLLPLTQK